LERALDHLWTILKPLADGGSLSFTDIVVQATPSVGSSSTVERTIAKCLKLGFVSRPKMGIYQITERGKQMVKALETPP
jgi:Mn-dependent DtxR family transcriptional regulator